MSPSRPPPQDKGPGPSSQGSGAFVVPAAASVYQSIGDAFRRLHESLSTEQLEFLVRYQEDSIALTQEEIERLT